MDFEYISREKIYKHLYRNNDCYYVNEIYSMTTSEDVQRVISHKWAFLGSKVVFVLSIILSGILLLVNLMFEQKYDYNNKIAIARVPSEKRKIANVCEEIQFIEDNIKDHDFTIYRIGSRIDRFTFLIKSYIKFCIRDFYEIKRILKNEYLAPFTSTVLLAYAKRIPHTVIYKHAIEHIMIKYNLSTIYIGATYERFAMIGEILSKKHNKKLICFPHGVVSTEKVPGGYVGDVFYCTSLEMASKLNDLYETSKFIFDDDILSKMYRIKKISLDRKVIRINKVVFFTQPLESESTKDIMFSIAKHLRTKKQKLYIKVHPLEKLSDYNIEDAEIINDFEEAIIGNICISFSSTVLVEALYNDSTSISIIHLVNDTVELTERYEFLGDSRILKPKDMTLLLQEIDSLI